MWATGRRTGSGFTLLELLVVLALVALLASALPIAFRHLMPGQQLEVATSELASQLRALQTKSALMGEKQEFRVEDAPEMAAGITIELAVASRAATLDRVSPDLAALDRDTPQSGAHGTMPFDTLEFFPDGSSSGGRLTLTLGDRRSTLLVSALTGRVRQGSP